MSSHLASGPTSDNQQPGKKPSAGISDDAAAPAPSVPVPSPSTGGYSGLISGIGYVLAASYPVLALSTGTRALYQLFFKAGVTTYLPALLSLLAAAIYVVAAFGFAYRRPWTWRLSLAALSIETVLVLVVGTWSVVAPQAIGRTVWRHYGEDYGYFPLIQPLIGLLWLLWPATRSLYDAHAPAEEG